MRRLALAVLAVLVLATPAFGDDVTKKHEIDTRLSSLQDKLAAQKRNEQSLRNEVAGFTARIRTLEAKVGDVSLRLKTLEADLSLHEGRLDALNALDPAVDRSQQTRRSRSFWPTSIFASWPRRPHWRPNAHFMSGRPI